MNPISHLTLPASLDPALAATIQKTVWEIVAAHPDAGVATARASSNLP